MKKKFVVVIILLFVVITLIFSFKNYYDKLILSENIEFMSSYFLDEVLYADEDYIFVQNKYDEVIEEYVSLNLSLTDAMVIVNPYEISPLTAVIIFSTDELVSVTLSMYGEVYEFEESYSHVVPIVGLISGEVSEVIITAGDETKTFSFDMSDVVFDIDVDVIYNDGDLDSGIFLFTNPNSDGAFGIDEGGNFVWRLTSTNIYTPTVLDNGHLLLSTEDFSEDNYSKKGFVEIDYLGKIYNVYEIETGYHHDLEVLPNGNVLISSSNYSSETETDYIVEVNLSDGSLVRTIDLSEIISAIDPLVVDSSTWFYNNGLAYDEENNSIVLSSRMQNAVISLDYDTLEINYIFGDPDYWSEAFFEYMVSYEGEYFLGVHTADVNSSGYITLFNNNYDKSNPQSSDYYKNFESSAQIYSLQNNEAVLIGEFTDDFYSYAVSSFKELDNGNYALLVGWQIPSEYMTDDKNLNDLSSYASSTIYELDENLNEVFKMDVGIAGYSLTKVKFYSELNDNMSTENLEYYSNYERVSYENVDLSDIKEKITDAEVTIYATIVSNYEFYLKAGFTEEDELSVYFINEEAEVFKYSLEAYGSLESYRIDVQELSGTFKIFLEVNEKSYYLNNVYELN